MVRQGRRATGAGHESAGARAGRYLAVADRGGMRGAGPGEIGPSGPRAGEPGADATRSGGVLEGAAAGVAASIVQAFVGKAEELLLLPPGEDADIAPRLVDRVAQRFGARLPPAVKWGLGTAFHLGYGALWGGFYGLVQRRHPLPALLAGAGLGLLIYGITFPRWGAAVKTGAERPPSERSTRMTVVAASVALTYGLMVAVFFERLASRQPR
jgi:hypothetical protein